VSFTADDPPLVRHPAPALDGVGGDREGMLESLSSLPPAGSGAATVTFRREDKSSSPIILDGGV
jgi:hypothetical protein